MYELSRVRLYAVGPKAARYQDITLDLRDVGAAVAKPVAPVTLFDTTRTVVRRPAPASVLFAENGNGKSVLIKLIFSVMLPGRKQIVGTTNTKAMENFVLAEDVSHVALEWMHVDTGELVVTAKASAWRDHRVSADSSRLTEAWYSFRPTPEFGLDDLPFTEHGRLVGLPGYRDRLNEAGTTQPHLQMGWENNQRDWTTKLTNLGLDPELFAYQRRMNAGEGEAADAFSFKSDEAFTDWLLTSVLDKEGPRSLSDVLDAYATRLAERDAVVAERDFVSGALERLTPLAAAARDYQAAQDIQAEAARDATRLAAALVLRQKAEDARLAVLLDEQEALEGQVEAADRDQRRLNRIVLELRRIVAGLRLDEALATEKALEERRATALATLTAWRSTDVLLRFRQIHEEANALRATIGEREAEAAGPLAARDAAAQRLVHGLIVAANAADEAAQEAHAHAKALTTQIGEATAEETEHHKAAERFRGHAKAVTDKINALQGRIDDAVRAGLLPAGADLHTTAADAETTAQAAEQAVTAADAEAKTLRGKRRAAETTLREAAKAAAGATRAFEDATKAHNEALTATTTLAAEDRFAALLGTDEVLLDTDASPLLERLVDAIEQADTERDRLRDADREGQRVLDALGSGGLLPPPVEVTTVRDTLRDAGIACYTGWEYLAQMPEGERDLALTTYPHLVDGIVLNSPDQTDAAQQVLTDARLLPSAIVAVGATAVFEHLTDVAAPTGLAFLVPPNPALYDEDLAEQERLRLTDAQTERRIRIRGIEEQVETDRTLRTRLTGWLDTYPPGTLTRLAEAQDAAEERAARAADNHQAAQVAFDTINDAEDDLDKRLPGLRRTAQTARQSADRLATLADEHAHVPGWTEEVRVARENATLADDTAERAHKTAERLRGEKEEAVRRQDDHKRTADAHRHEITQTPGGGNLDPTGPAPTEPIETLKAAYRAAVTAYEKVQVGADLRADLSAIEKTEAEAQGAVENLPPPIRTEATTLLSSPDGGDVPARAAATGRAQRVVDDLDKAIREAGTTVGGLRAKYEEYAPQETTLEPYGRPENIEHGEDLARRAAEDWRAATTRYAEISGRANDLRTRIETTGREAGQFADLVDTLSDSVPDDIDEQTTTAYAGTLVDARTARDTRRAALREANEFLTQATNDIRATSSAVHRYSADQRFESVDSPVRRQILAVDLDRLYEHGPDWEEALKPRLRSLQDELAQIDRHRNQIILNLRGHVETALRTLKAAERVSELPDTLGDWAGQHFLRIRFKDPDPAALNERLAAVIDTAVAGEKGSGKRDGMTIVIKGVRAALPHGVKVEMLKPDATLRAERVRISEVADVFSGGQLLTAAIILYCTMAALRANDRGRVRNSHAGVLFLDNPIGRASAGYLLELQLGVAHALGVQLVYTTGLFDLNALSVFPLIIRLRNDRDVRTGKKYLTVDDEIRSHLTALGDPDGTGRIAAARLFRRPTDHPTAPSTPVSVAAGEGAAW
ncbi:hypothetical protein [Nocardioides euryhalodurans]|uniref:Chromosome segregation ATPase n=1 Tax=Nocardioides euryhalodurans TaxID=2518370 RepID=A0A4P7GNG4_9ACTN|nr:hypothetical protein [Nocardioides euryhalodurans]QBR93746.1 hypothetical protein EXE57_16790 [Nocardioides euryhalodurans]